MELLKFNIAFESRKPIKALADFIAKMTPTSYELKVKLTIVVDGYSEANGMEPVSY